MSPMHHPFTSPSPVPPPIPPLSNCSYGQASAAAAWFGSLGYSLPFGCSLADFILDLASGEVGTQHRWAELTKPARARVACANV